MDTPASSAAVILVVTDIITDATLVKKLLNPEFDHVFTCTDTDKLAGDFVRYHPNVLVLAFNSIEKSERHYLGLYRLCPEVHQYPHRAVDHDMVMYHPKEGGCSLARFFDAKS